MDLDLPPIDELERHSERGQLWLPGIDEVYRNAAPIAMRPPIIKYAGGKSWLVPLVVPRLHLLLVSLDGATYVEPFAGGLAVGLALGWPRAVYADSNVDLMNLYAAITIDPMQVADELDALVSQGWDEPTYYEVRRSIWPENRPAINQFAWAARVLYLNKTAFNGLWRTNKRGQFNVPYGRYAQPAFPSREVIARTAAVLAPSDLRCADFGEVLARVLENGPQRAVVYLDPPYGEVLAGLTAAGRTRGREAPSPLFVGYTSESFTWKDQVRLAEAAASLRDAGAVVVATNTWSDAVRDLWSDFDHFQCRVRHSVGATADRRGDRAELIAISPAHAGLLEQSNLRLDRRR